MDKAIPPIPLTNLALAFLPVLVVVVLLFRWRVGGTTAVYAVGRMLLQLLAVGYVLAFLFAAEQPAIVVLAMAVMLSVASWIALRPLVGKRRLLIRKSFGAIAVGGIATLGLVTQGVLELDPWFRPQYMIPLAGMIFANGMNTVSLAGERFFSEIERGQTYLDARRTAMRAALIPITNSLLAVGLVSIPGMMTGQILSGISPLVAVRYQIMVMCMIYGSAGITAAFFLYWLREPVEDFKPQSAP